MKVKPSQNKPKVVHGDLKHLVAPISQGRDGFVVACEAEFAALMRGREMNSMSCRRVRPLEDESRSWAVLTGSRREDCMTLDELRLRSDSNQP